MWDYYRSYNYYHSFKTCASGNRKWEKSSVVLYSFGRSHQTPLAVLLTIIGNHEVQGQQCSSESSEKKQSSQKNSLSINNNLKRWIIAFIFQDIVEILPPKK